MNIAIVGGGVAGSSVLRGLLDHPNLTSEDQIVVFDHKIGEGHGQPYRKDDPSVLLNVGPDRMSIVPDNEHDFVDWLDKHYPNADHPEHMVPRTIYSEYLDDRLNPLYQHPKVTVIEDKVVDVQVLNEQGMPAQNDYGGQLYYQVFTENELANSHFFRVIFFAFGHPPYADYYDLLGSDHYIHNPYPVRQALSPIEDKQKVGIIGSGSAALDAMRYLIREKELKKPLTFYVRSEPFDLPQVPLKDKNYQFSVNEDFLDRIEKNGGVLVLDEWAQLVEDDFKQAGLSLQDIYLAYQPGSLDQYRQAVETLDQALAFAEDYIQSMSPMLDTLYNALNGIDKKRFEESYMPIIDYFRSTVPHHSFLWILDLIDQGDVRVVSGLTEIQPTKKGAFKIKADKKEKVDVLVNGTGFQLNLYEASKQDVLIKNLLKKEIIYPASMDEGILVDWPSSRLINQRFGLMKNAYFFGVWIGHTQYTNNDAVMNRDHAYRIGKSFQL